MLPILNQVPNMSLYRTSNFRKYIAFEGSMYRFSRKGGVTYYSRYTITPNATIYEHGLMNHFISNQILRNGRELSEIEFKTRTNSFKNKLSKSISHD